MQLPSDVRTVRGHRNRARTVNNTMLYNLHIDVHPPFAHLSGIIYINQNLHCLVSPSVNSEVYCKVEQLRRNIRVSGASRRGRSQ